MTDWTLSLYGPGGLLSETRISSPDLPMTYAEAIRAAGLEDTPIGDGDRIVVVANDDDG